MPVYLSLCCIFHDFFFKKNLLFSNPHASLCKRRPTIVHSQQPHKRVGSKTDRRIDAVRVDGALTEKQVVRVAAGLSHSVAVTSDDELYVWGSNDRGQLGVNDRPTKSFAEPQAVRAIDWRAHGGIGDVCAGGQHTIVVTRDGAAFAFGAASWGATALGHTDDTLTPTRVAMTGGDSNELAVRQVSCGGDHTLFLLQNGTLMASVTNSSLLSSLNID